MYLPSLTLLTMKSNIPNYSQERTKIYATFKAMKDFLPNKLYHEYAI